MENNLHNNEQQNYTIAEKKSGGNSMWYWLIALLVLLLVGWYGYTAGWFAQRATTPQVPAIVESNNSLQNLELSENAAPIDSVRIETSEGFPVQQALVVSGTLPNGCTYINAPNQFRDGNVFYVTIDTRTEGEICTEALVPYEERIELPVNNLPAGVYVVNVNGREVSFELDTNNELDFSAGSDK